MIPTSAGFADLPAARDEVLAVARLFNASTEVAVVGNMFTKASVLERKLGTYNALLFATHNTWGASQTADRPPGLVVS